MKNFIKRLFKFIKARYAPHGARQSFAGSGEDLIMADLLNKFGIKKDITYIDIGAYHPVFGNNTFYFYRVGGRGVLVEPNKNMCKSIGIKRPRDICINAGVAHKDGVAKFYSFSQSTRNTFSLEEAKAWEKISGDKPKIIYQKLISLDTIINNYCSDKVPDIVSIDTEGYEYKILSNYSWKVRPKLICLEVVSSSQIENSIIYKFMEENNYKLVAKTNINSIFADNTINI